MRTYRNREIRHCFLWQFNFAGREFSSPGARLQARDQPLLSFAIGISDGDTKRYAKRALADPDGLRGVDVFRTCF